MSLVEQFIHPDNLREVWPEVRTRLERMCDRAKSDWLPEDVYMSCKSGNAGLHMLRRGGRMVGFFVLEVTQEFGIKSLHVWIMHHDGQGDEGMYRSVLSSLKDYAQQAQCKRIRFATHRKGWAKRLQQHGFKPVLTTLELRL